MTGGARYVDSRAPYIIADETAITLATTQKALWPVARTTIAVSDWEVGKTFRLTAFLKLVQDATAGNYVFAMGCGTGDAPAAIVVSTARAGVSGGAITGGCFIQGYATCRSLGTAGTISMWGMAYCDLTLMLSTVQPNVFPVGGVTVVSTINTEVGTNALTFQLSRSGAGVWTAQTVGLALEAMN